MLRRDQRLAVYMEGATTAYHGKMGFGVIRYSPNPVVCVIDSEKAGRDMADVARMPRSVPIVATVREARALGAEVLVLGIAPVGGLVPGEWYPAIDDAVSGGMSVLNGLHDLLAPRYPNLSPGQWVWDVRVEPPGLQPSTGAAAALANRRALMIGTDMSVGKMTTGLEIFRAARERGIRTEFVATGQIGITVTGSGVPLDAIRLDFAAGAIEREVMSASAPLSVLRDEGLSEETPHSRENGERAGREVTGADLIIVEGQGSLCHPASSATLPLLRGSMPTHLVLCHRAGQASLVRLPEVKIPPLKEFANLYTDLAGVLGTFPKPKLAAASLNTFDLPSDDEAKAACMQVEDDLGVPCVDPVRHGPDRLLDAITA